MMTPRFWREFEKRYNLIGAKCERCGEYYYPPRNLCPRCRRFGEMVLYKFNGKGEVVTYTVIYNPPSNFTGRAPYILAIIKLDEGPRLTSQVICDISDIHIGMKVRPVFRKLGQEGKKGIIYYGTKFVPREVE